MINYFHILGKIMKTFFKYCLFIFALAISQMSWAADNDNCPLDSKGNRISNCKNPVCSPGKTTYPLDNRKCIDSCKDGYSSTSSADFICYQNCRDGYSNSTVGMCHYTAGGTTYTKSCHTEKISCSYWPGTKVVKKCSGGGTKCDGCRDGYRDDGLICSYTGAWDYAKDSYTRGTTVRWKDTCENGWKLKVSTIKDGGNDLYYYCENCGDTPETTSTISMDHANGYYTKSSNATFTANLNVTKGLCNASSNSTITMNFVISKNNANGTTTQVGTTSCTFPTTGKDIGTYSCNATYNVGTTPGDFTVTATSRSSVNNANLAPPGNALYITVTN